MDHVLGQDGGGGGAIAGDVVGFDRRFLEELGAHVFKGVFQLDFLGDGDAVVGDGRRAELLVDGDVAALGAEGGGYGRGDRVDAAFQLAASVFREYDLLRRHFILISVL